MTALTTKPRPASTPRRGAEAPPPAFKRRKGSLHRSQALAGWIFSAPFVAIFLVFSAWPIIWSLVMSFTDMTSRDIRTPFDVNFAGLDNFISILSDPRFVKSLVNTGIIVVAVVPTVIVVALLVAVALNTGINRGKGFFRTVFYMPVVTSVVAIAVIWKLLFADTGAVNGFLSIFGIHGQAWLGETTWALPVIILLIVWRLFGLVMVLLLAGLQTVPAELYEAARVDGASAWRRLVSITVPMLLPQILLAGVLMTVTLVQVFEEQFVITNGAPLDSTLSASMYVYQQFGYGHYGQASAASYLLFIIIGLLSLLQFRVLRTRS